MIANPTSEDRVRSVLRTAARYECGAGHVWRGRIAPAHEVPRNESNNKAHEPTSGRSTRYGSGHLIRVFRDIGHIFSSQCPSHWRFCFLVVLPCPRDLLLCAKHLFVAAMAPIAAAWGQGFSILKQGLASIPLTQTTLPAWLGAASQKRLARRAPLTAIIRLRPLRECHRSDEQMFGRQ